MLRSANVATPATAVTVAVPVSTPPGPALLAIAIVTPPVKDGVMLPAASRASTTTAGPIAAPAVTWDGWTVNASWAGGPTAMSKLALTPGVSAPDDAVKV